MKLYDLFLAMLEFEEGCSHRAQHLTKVWTYAKLIGEGENLDPDTLYTLQVAAIVHDIGIKIGLEKEGSSAGPIQEKYGAEFVVGFLKNLGCEQAVIDRVAYLVGHHHTYDNIDGIDYQILVEADFIVNTHENNSDKQTIINTLSNIFKTDTGKCIYRKMFNV